MMSCREVTRIVASDQLAEAPRARRLGVRLHHLMCRHCRRYASQLRALGKAARSIWGPGSPDPDSLPRLERVLLDEIHTRRDAPASPGPSGDGSGGERNQT